MGNSKAVVHSKTWRLGIGERKFLLFLGDFVVATTSMIIALYFWGSSQRFMDFSWEFIKKRTPFWFYLLPIIWILLIIELYDLHNAANIYKTIRGVVIAGVVGLLIYVLLYFYYVDPPRSLLPRRGVATFLISASILTLLWRIIYINVFSSSQFMRRVIIIGGGKRGEFLINVINGLDIKPYKLVGIVDDDEDKQGTKIQGCTVLGKSCELEKIIEKNDVSDVFVTISGDFGDSMFQALLSIQQSGIRITSLPVIYEELLGRVPIELLDDEWILKTFVDEVRVNNFFDIGKRLIDIFSALIGVSLVALVSPFVALAVVLESGGPILFFQKRSGRGGKEYTMIKFRTMYQNAESDGQPHWATESDNRATKVGKFLRKTHIDELPQFINVLKGDMSLVGPRAERPELIDAFAENIPFYKARLIIKPGLTGWAQVNFGYASTIEETKIKLEYDLFYIKNRTFLLDIVIMLRTPATMLGFRGR